MIMSPPIVLPCWTMCTITGGALLDNVYRGSAALRTMECARVIREGDGHRRFMATLRSSPR